MDLSFTPAQQLRNRELLLRNQRLREQAEHIPKGSAGRTEGTRDPTTVVVRVSSVANANDKFVELNVMTLSLGNRSFL